MQGYLFGKPISAEEFAVLLEEDAPAWEAEIEAAGID
jgi:EAL domain-containing protein (putative c-di-GMP-specific phosphodiesterase class I)